MLFIALNQSWNSKLCQVPCCSYHTLKERGNFKTINVFEFLAINFKKEILFSKKLNAYFC